MCVCVFVCFPFTSFNEMLSLAYISFEFFAVAVSLSISLWPFVLSSWYTPVNAFAWLLLTEFLCKRINAWCHTLPPRITLSRLPYVGVQIGVARRFVYVFFVDLYRYGSPVYSAHGYTRFLRAYHCHRFVCINIGLCVCSVRSAKGILENKNQLNVYIRYFA